MPISIDQNTPNLASNVRTLDKVTNAPQTDFMAAPEEWQTIVNALQKDWDANEHIVKLFNRNKNLLTKSANICDHPTHSAEDFIECTHVVICKTCYSTKIA